MKLSDGEKIIMLMLADLYEKLKIAGEIDPKFIKETLFSNQTWGFRWQFTGMGLSEEPDPELVTETVDILDMYRFLNWGFDKLTAHDKERVQKAIYPWGSNMEFPGFDGNHDPHKGVARYLADQLERFTDLPGVKNNSHSSASLPQYRRMLRTFKPIRDTLSRESLSADQIIQIFTKGTGQSSSKPLS